MQKQENATLGNTLQEEIKPNRSPPSDSNHAHGLKSLKQMPTLATLPEVPPAFDFWGVLLVNVDPSHLVALIILTKVAPDLNDPASRDLLPALWAATQLLKTHLLSSNEKAEQFAAMLSRVLIPPSSTDGGVEVLCGPDGHPAGFTLGDAHVQVVMTCVILANGQSSPDSPNLYPFIANDIVDTYILPEITDFVEFGRYLLAKTQHVWHGKHLPVILTTGLNNPRLYSEVLTYGGWGIVIYCFIAGLFMTSLLSSAPYVIYGAPCLLLFIVVFALALKKRNSRAGRLAASNYLRAMSWRAGDCPPDVVQEKFSRLSPTHAAQLLCEINNPPSIPHFPHTDNHINDARKIKENIIKIR